MKFVQGFDLIYLFAESRLGDVQSVGGPSKVQLFGQDNHRMQMTYFNPREHFSSSLPHRRRLVNALHLVKEPATREKYQNKVYFRQSAERAAGQGDCLTLTRRHDTI